MTSVPAGSLLVPKVLASSKYNMQEAQVFSFAFLPHNYTAELRMYTKVRRLGFFVQILGRQTIKCHPKFKKQTHSFKG